jgi:hypothetical protein
MNLHEWEEFAVSKFHKSGKCANSVFTDGGHRVGMIPVRSVLDGGAPGDVCQEYCLECGKSFSGKCFVLRDQPSRVGEGDSK